MEIRSIWLSDMKQTLSSLSGDTIKAIVLVCLAVGVVGMSYGSLAVAYGFPLWVPLVLSVSVLAGASEFMFIGIVASGGSPLRRRRRPVSQRAPYPFRGDRARTGWSARLKLYRVPHYERRERGLWLVAAHPRAAQSGLLAVRRRRSADLAFGYAHRRRRRQTAAGAETIGLDAVFPAILLALVIPGL